MKTAMQELLHELKEYQLEFNIPIEVIDMCESQLNVEKEQIADAFVECWKANMPDGFECKLSAKDYYNQTYNQNK